MTRELYCSLLVMGMLLEFLALVFYGSTTVVFYGSTTCICSSMNCITVYGSCC